jgi:hypothetical protein
MMVQLAGFEPVHPKALVPNLEFDFSLHEKRIS